MASPSHGHGGMNSELPSFVTRCAENASTSGIGSDHDGLSDKARVEDPFYRNEKSVHIEVCDLGS